MTDDPAGSGQDGGVRAEAERPGPAVGAGDQGRREGARTVPASVALLPTDLVLFPHMVAPAVVTPRWAPVIDEAARENQMIGVFARRVREEEFEPSHLHPVGTLARVVRLLRLPDGSMQVILQGGAKVRLGQVLATHPVVRAQVEPIEERVTPGAELEALQRTVMDLFQELVERSSRLPDELAGALDSLEEETQRADFVAAHGGLSTEEQAEMLALPDVNARLRRLAGHLQRELEIVALGQKIRSDAQGEMEKTQREYYLREQLKAIQRELGELTGSDTEIDDLREQLARADLPDEARQEAERELERLARMTPASPEYSIARTYLDWVLHLPWRRSSEDQLDLPRAERILDEDHYDLEKVKGRLLDYLAVLSLKPDTRSPILCLAGPPGVGKTSLGQSIARALGREFVRVSMGGVRDEAELRGHRRTYIGALPGRILQGLRRAGSSNPVFMLDEVDKIGADYRGDPAAALLEVLDPEQNHAFSDHYLGVPFDLSRVLFIATANTLHTIPPALLDRMEVIEIPGYTEPEKMEIARRYLLPRQIEENGLRPGQIALSDDALQEVIRHYTREAGVRSLEREIGSVCRRVARRVASGDLAPVQVGSGLLPDYLGPPRFRLEVAEEKDEVGVSTGLFWTPSGGGVLFVEALAVPGKGRLNLTGQLGDVMKESAQAAVTYARSTAGRWGLSPRFPDDADVHLHIPAGAVPKDGPSAGVALLTALVSALSRRPVRKDIAMTGEITLRGKVLPVGGIKEKVLAAHRAGVAEVVLPAENESDLSEVPEHVRAGLQIHLAARMEEVLALALQEPVQEADAAA